MHPPRAKLGAVSIAFATALGLATGNAHAESTANFHGWTPLSDYVSAGLAEGGSFRLTFPTRSGPVEVDLHPVDVHGARYHAEEAMRGGERHGRRRPEVRTFAGTTEAARGNATESRPRRGGDFARLSQGPDGRVSGLLRVDGVLYDVSGDPAAGDLVLALHEIDPLELGALLGGCGAALDEALAGAPLPSDGGAAPTASESAAAGVLREIELGTEADALFVTQTGGVAAANAKILSIVNAINGIYETDLGLTNRVVFQRAWNGSDPYTSNDSGVLLDEFRSGFLTDVATGTDDAQLFSGRDFESSVVGRAYVSAACTSARFGVNQYYQQSESLTRLIAAHEMGHNLGASHSVDGLMAPSINPSVTWFSAFSQNEIASYVNGLSCLAAVTPGGPPVITPIGPQTTAENTTLSLQLEASDPDGGAIVWSAQPLPIGASLSASGRFQWRPALDTVGCGGQLDVPVTFYASDPDGDAANETVVISVLDTPTGAAPHLSDPVDRSVLVGQALSIPLSASDADGDPLSFGAGSLPTGATLSPSGSFAWTPSADQLGVHDLSFSAIDCGGHSASQNVAVEVVPSAPLLSGLSAASGQKGDEITIYGQNLAGRKVKVYFGAKRKKPSLVSDTSLVVRVPKVAPAASAVSISVLRDGVASQNSLPFSYLLPSP